MNLKSNLFSASDPNFPVSTDLPDGVRCLRLPPDDGLACQYFHDVVYASRSGEKQALQILVPRERTERVDPDRRWPTVVYLPGSGWRRATYRSTNVPAMVDFCRRGYVVVIVEYRPSDLAPFPAQMIDVQTAIRYVKEHAADYRADPNKIALWGQSSGGHLAALCGLAGDRETEGLQFSAEVDCIVDLYGPTDIIRMKDFPSTIDHMAADSPEGYLIGRCRVDEYPDRAAAANPLNYIDTRYPSPPVLIMHGDSDRLVPFNQSVLLYERLREMDKDVECYKLMGAGHGNDGFPHNAAEALVDEFIRRKLDIK